ncbi:MAG: 5'-nucleotidase C-terminal domain-containing protein [Treponema sp.]|nr:5'-nucleotidase C-terminal domain-containing protein [Treponema sp.]MCL2237115.1 5'-nucleotidase C-terminal domain-containing protein [Treponema sp.]
MKKRALVLFVVFLLANVLYAAAIREGSNAGRSGEIILLHTNDFHGALLANNGRGGAAEIAAFVNAVRAVTPNVLLVDAGDFNTGGALSNMFNAEPVIRAYNMMGYDAVTFGNHEFDTNMQRLNEQIALADFPFVSSNIRLRDGTYLGGNRFIIKQFGDIKVGIFGITTLRTRTVSNPDSSLVFINELEAAREVVAVLRNDENVDIVIGLTHMGDVKESDEHITSIELAKAIEGIGIDIIVDGHSHTLFDTPRRAGDTWVVSANEMGKYVGYGRISVRNGRLEDFDWIPMPIGPDPAINEMLRPYIERAGVTLREVIGEASDTFVFGNRLTRYQETALGNMIADANVWYFRNVSNQQVDFAFQNGGNIRAELPRGQITQERILTILPFENYLYIVSMTGAQLIELFDFMATIPQGSGGFPQFSAEVRVTFDKTQGGGVMRNLTIGGEPVDPARIYRICTNDYILGGGDGYVPMLNASNHFNTSLLLSYVVTEYIRARGGVIAPQTDGRLTIIGGVAL